jgi:catechol 2,3-dioxygenase-like lactoylglutathione lyase family enzyme
MSSEKPIPSISAVTLMVSDMGRSVRFYRSLGFELSQVGPGTRFTTMGIGNQYLNLMASTDTGPWTGWGRVILHVRDVDAIYEVAVAVGLQPEAPPRDAEWGERYFHLLDPDGHEISFAQPLHESL